VSAWAIATCAVLYLVSAIDFWRKDQSGLALTFLAYAVANIGLILAARGK